MEDVPALGIPSMAQMFLLEKKPATTIQVSSHAHALSC